METFFDGDLKDIWDSDLDPTDSLKMSTDTDMQEWFMDREVKDPAVILNDKLISDALLNGTVPIKSEHSYSLNSDGDSNPDSPRSLQTKIDDMEDECYPAISLTTATSNIRHADSAASATIDPKCLTISSANAVLGNGSNSISSSSCSSIHNSSLMLPMHGGNSSSSSSSCSSSSIFDSGLTGKMGGANSLSFNLRTLERDGPGPVCSSGGGGGGVGGGGIKTRQKREASCYLPRKISNIGIPNICGSPASSREGSTSPDICSDIEIDESCIKDEPISPHSSYPPSPTTTNGTQVANTIANGSTLSLNMAKMAAFANSDLVFEHRNGCLQLTPASHSLLKSQQLLMGSTNIIIPKFSIKSEMANNSTNSLKVHTTTPGKGGAYGLPLTPPSSLQSDDSEGNVTPEHLLSPLSPNSSVSVTVSSATGGSSGTASGSGLPISTGTGAAAVRRGTGSSSSSSSSVSCHSSGRNISGGGSTRQPIHTPLISSQPKGSTGNLILTEEEKRTLLAEGYPIPQKLPLTKAEEKSLKKIRRKIKNKISAQESRRKKKEYMDQLERRVEILNNENCEYRKRVDALEDTNANLLSQLHKLQALVQKQGSKKP